MGLTSQGREGYKLSTKKEDISAEKEVKMGNKIVEILLNKTIFVDKRKYKNKQTIQFRTKSMHNVF